MEIRAIDTRVIDLLKSLEGKTIEKVVVTEHEALYLDQGFEEVTLTVDGQVVCFSGWAILRLGD